jgi:hypothetical protein
MNVVPGLAFGTTARPLLLSTNLEPPVAAFDLGKDGSFPICARTGVVGRDAGLGFGDAVRLLLLSINRDCPASEGAVRVDAG